MTTSIQPLLLRGLIIAFGYVVFTVAIVALALAVAMCVTSALTMVFPPEPRFFDPIFLPIA